MNLMMIIKMMIMIKLIKMMRIKMMIKMMMMRVGYQQGQGRDWRQK